MSVISRFTEDKKTLVSLFANHYSHAPGDELTADNWIITSMAPRFVPFFYWHSHFVHFEMRCIQYSKRWDFWHFDVLEITANLSAVVLRGEKGNKNIPHKLYLYKTPQNEAIPLPGESFRDLPWYCILKVFWDKWHWLFIYMAILVVVFLLAAR